MTQSQHPIATTRFGELRGSVKDGTQLFLGITYGKSTGGKRRFMPPEPPEPWKDVRDALDFGPVCPQGGPLAGKPEPTVDNEILTSLPDLPLSEDCLSLNIWTPAIKDNGKRPVMLWLHGRGFAEGAGSEGWYDGTQLSKHGNVVVVTVNHRLNTFGYLYLAELGGEKYAASGLNGMLDVVLALEWVRDNIAEFGGDPDNVTIFGESGGGVKVSTLLALPQAKGLFHKAIIQSGPGITGIKPDDATKLATKILDHLRIKKNELHKLHDVSPQQLLDAVAMLSAKSPGISTLLAPVMDGKLFPSHPFVPKAAPTAVDIPLIIGTNRDENALFSTADPKFRQFTEEDLHRRLDRLLGERKNEILGVYKKNRPNDTPWDLYIGIMSENMRLWSIQLAEAKAASGGAPVYMYLFAWKTNFMDGIFKSCHALEIPFVFNNPDSSPITGDKKERYDLASIMSQTWINFARTGDPGSKGLPHWPAYDKENRATMIFDVPCRVENDPGEEERRVWKGKPAPRR